MGRSPGSSVSSKRAGSRYSRSSSRALARALRRGTPLAEVERLDVRAAMPEGMPALGDGPTVQLWPHRHGTDAMFVALLRRPTEG